MKKLLFMACMACLLLFSVAVAEDVWIEGGTFADPLYSTNGFEITVAYDRDVLEWQAHILKAPVDCSYVPATVSCTADMVRYTNGEYSEHVPVTARVTWICDGAFKDCKDLTSVLLDPGVELIGNEAFAGCPLTEIYVPDSVTEIGASAFAGSVPENVTLPFTGSRRNNTTGNDRFFSWIFAGNDGGPADIPGTVRTVTVTDQGGIRNEAFRDCTGIIEIHLGDAATYIGSGSFQGCTALREITLPAGLESIDWSAFEGCTALESVRYGGSPCMRALIETGSTNEPLSNAAWEYALTKELLLPKDVQEVGPEALAGNAAQVVLIPEGCAAVAADAFDNCPALRYIVNRSETEIEAPDGAVVLQR